MPTNNLRQCVHDDVVSLLLLLAVLLHGAVIEGPAGVQWHAAWMHIVSMTGRRIIQLAGRPTGCCK